MGPTGFLGHVGHLEYDNIYYKMWGKYHMYQNGAEMSHRRRRGRWVERSKKADLPHAKSSVQMPNYITMDLIDGYNHARMTSECLDPDGEE